jgi:hypothetical protein
MGLTSLRNIPRIMRDPKNNMLNGAKLLDDWFSRPSTIRPSYSAPETTTIRMDRFVLTFSRAKAKYDELMTGRIWANPAARAQTRTVLSRNGLLRAAPATFGDFSRPVTSLDADSVNFLRYDEGFQPLDDLFAALAKFTFKVVLAGSVTPLVLPAKGWRVTVNRVGVYVRDSFDFAGYQELGSWDEVSNTVTYIPTPRHTRVTNADFRSWRSTHLHGGDFLVFSDLKVTTLPTPDVFNVL